MEQMHGSWKHFTLDAQVLLISCQIINVLQPNDT